MKSDDLEIIPLETSERVRPGRDVPTVRLSVNGFSYFTARAASLLELKHGDAIRFFASKDRKTWFVGKMPAGALIQKIQGMYRFCEVAQVRQMFDALGINCRSASFPLAAELEERAGFTVLMIVPNPFNEK